jgi:septal ring factor EnvC (AmiA/AmiB activator)
MMLGKIALTGKIRAVLITAGVAAVTALVAALWIQSSRLDSAHEQNGRLQVRLDAAVEANQTNQETIDELKKANAQLLERIRLDSVAAEEAAREARERAAELRKQRDEARRQLDSALSSTPSCEALAQLDLAGACPAFGDRLLDLYQRGRPDGDGDGRGPGSGPSP